MTRRSKREVAQAIDALTSGSDRAESGPSIGDVYPEDVTAFINGLIRSLLRFRRRHGVDRPGSPSEHTARLLSSLRERHAIDVDRDASVRRALETVGDPGDRRDSIDRFAAVLSAIAKDADPRTDDGETVADLVRSERSDVARRLLVRTTYAALADRGDRPTEVPA